MKRIFTIALVAGTLSASAQTLCFDPATNYPASINPASICSADFNGDGFKDLATANYGSNDVSVLLGTGTGTFGVATNFTVSSSPTSITSADFNGDGKADLATANYSTDNVSILLGNGAGSFGTAAYFATDLGLCYKMYDALIFR